MICTQLYGFKYFYLILTISKHLFNQYNQRRYLLQISLQGSNGDKGVIHTLQGFRSIISPPDTF